MRRIIVIISFILIYIHAIAQTDDLDIKQLFKVNDTCIATLPLDISEQWAWHLEGCSPIDISCFSKSKIDSIVKLLKKAVIKHNNSISADILGGDIYIGEYFIQIVGGVNDNEEYVFWINCLCNKYINKLQLNWRNKIIRVHDGGKCFFHVIINLTNLSSRNFYVNGY